MNLFNLAEVEILREGKEPSEVLIIEYAVKIRHWLDIHKTIAKKILTGHKVYKYGNRFKVKNNYINRVKFARLSVFGGYNTI
jgi:hypothetical protein